MTREKKMLGIRFAILLICATSSAFLWTRLAGDSPNRFWIIFCGQAFTGALLVFTVTQLTRTRPEA